jgi:hypothetical protein
MRVALVFLVTLPFLAAGSAGADLPVLKTTRPAVSVREGERLGVDSWRLAPELNPDVYDVDLENGVPKQVAFISDVDSIVFTVEEGRTYDFIIEHGADRCATRLRGVRLVPAAVFDAEYQAAHRGKITVLVPEVYELVNVAIALTPTAVADRNLVYQDSDYYAAVRKWFDPFRGHAVVAAIDAELKANPFRYHNIKMDGYSFEFDSAGTIVQSRIYDRTSFPSSRRNSLRPYIPALQSFADTSNFRAFYREHRGTYAEQIAFYADTAGIGEMRGWLDRQFPGTKPYDSYKVVFSPLVAYNQSSTWFESNGFRELQPHVNYPYSRDLERRVKGARLSPRAEVVLRGDIVFTELNHGYLSPTSGQYVDRIARAISRRDQWVDSTKGSSYYAGNALFDEYMNWGLVSLRVTDFTPAEEQERHIEIVDQMMTKGRGFPRFAAFDSSLVDLYRNRKTGETIADLYPRIIEWFEKENAAAARASGDRRRKPAAK